MSGIIQGGVTLKGEFPIPMRGNELRNLSSE